MQAIARLTWLVILVVFVFLLGGTHPSDAFRDRVLLVASGLVVALNLPLVIQLFRQWSTHSARSRFREVLLVIMRLAVAAAAFWYIHGISHEPPSQSDASLENGAERPYEDRPTDTRRGERDAHCAGVSSPGRVA